MFSAVDVDSEVHFAVDEALRFSAVDVDIKVRCCGCRLRFSLLWM